MDKNVHIIIVDSFHESEMMIKQIMKTSNYNDIIIIHENKSEISNNNQFPFTPEPIKIKNIPALKYIGEKTFICKGKHIYTEVKEDLPNGEIKKYFQCQCGRKL